MTKLSVNVNKIALLRNARKLDVPNVVRLSQLALQAGASGITIHPRPDERHIKAKDVMPLSRLVAQFENAEFNVEGNPFHQLMGIVEAVKPHQATLVPDDISAPTSDRGWDLNADGAKLEPIIKRLNDLGTKVSLFMDPLPEQMSLAKALGADRIELYTENYAQSFNSANRMRVTDTYRETAAVAAELGLGVNAGHDLNLDNLAYFLCEVPCVQEVSIGHALTADALEYGITETVTRYLREIRKSNVQ